MQKNSKQVVVDWYPGGFGICFRVNRKIFEKKTKFQKIEIYESENFGKLLFLDGMIQSVESSEESYHEILVHPALFAHPNPEKVLIIGGGEGATLREVLKHRNIKKAKMVDIDEEMIKIAKKYLKFDRGAFEDKRAEVIIDDGFEFIKKEKEKYDVIIVDATDPGMISLPLYTEKFYSYAYKILNSKGILVTQGGSCVFISSDKFKEVYGEIKKVFRKIHVYTFPIFGLAPGWSFIAGIKGNINFQKIKKPKKKIKLKFYDPENQSSLFSLSKYLEHTVSI